MNIRNVVRRSDTIIDCEYEHPVHGWIPYTAIQGDDNAFSHEVYLEATSGQHTITTDALLPKPVVVSVTPRQIRQALTRAGLRQQVEAAVAAGNQDLKDWWEFSTEIQRTHPMVIGMAQSLNISSDSLDALFLTASGL